MSSGVIDYEYSCSKLLKGVMLELVFLEMLVMLLSLISISSSLQEVMLRESRRAKGDPQVLTAQSREQYYKVLKYNKSMLFYIVMVSKSRTQFSSCKLFFSS